MGSSPAAPTVTVAAWRTGPACALKAPLRAAPLDTGLAVRRTRMAARVSQATDRAAVGEVSTYGRLP